MKRRLVILIIFLISACSACSAMKVVEDEMSIFLAHLEIDALSQESVTSQKSDKDEKGTAEQKVAIPASFSQPMENNIPKTVKHPQKETYRLAIQPFPEDSTIQLLHSKSQYSPGMRLSPGKYEVLVDHEGYESHREWINVSHDLLREVILKQKVEALQPVAPEAPLDLKEVEAAVPAEVEPGEIEKPVASEEVAPTPAEQENMINAPTGLQFPATLSGHFGSVSSLAFSPNGSLLASGGYDSMVILWKMDDGGMVHHLNHEDRVTAVAFSPDGRILASAGCDKTIKLWNVYTGELLKKFTGHTSKIHSVAFGRTGVTLVSGGENELIVWDVITGKIKKRLIGAAKLSPRIGTISDIVFNPMGKSAGQYEFAFTCYHGIALYDPDTEKLCKLADTSTPHSVTYSPDGTYIAWGARHMFHKERFFPRVVPVATEKRDPGLSRDDEMAKADKVFYTKYTPDGKRLVMLTYNQAVLYDIKTGTILEKFIGTSETAVTDAALSSDGHLLAASIKKWIRIWVID